MELEDCLYTFGIGLGINMEKPKEDNELKLGKFGDITAEHWYKFTEDGKWHHVVMTNKEFFMDGELKGKCHDRTSI